LWVFNGRWRQNRRESRECAEIKIRRDKFHGDWNYEL
jgi:hypothetical protein